MKFIFGKKWNEMFFITFALSCKSEEGRERKKKYSNTIKLSE